MSALRSGREELECWHHTGGGSVRGGASSWLLYERYWAPNYVAFEQNHVV